MRNLLFGVVVATMASFVGGTSVQAQVLDVWTQDGFIFANGKVTTFFGQNTATGLVFPVTGTANIFYDGTKVPNVAVLTPFAPLPQGGGIFFEMWWTNSDGVNPPFYVFMRDAKGGLYLGTPTNYGGFWFYEDQISPWGAEVLFTYPSQAYTFRILVADGSGSGMAPNVAGK